MNKTRVNNKLVKWRNIIRKGMNHFKQLTKCSRTIRFNINSFTYKMLRIRNTTASFILFKSTPSTSYRKMTKTKDEFRTTLGRNIFFQKYAHNSNDTWSALSNRLVKDVCEGILDESSCGCVS